MKGTWVYDDGSFNEVEGVHHTFSVKQRLFSMNAASFLGLLERVEFAASRDEKRYNLGAVAMEVHPDRIVCVATDGRRLAMCQESIEGAVEEPTIWNIAVEQVPTIIDIAKKWNDLVMFDVSSDGEVETYGDGRYYQMRAQLAMTDSFMRKNEHIALSPHFGQYPIWRRALPVSQPYKVTVGCSELKSKLEAMFEGITKTNVDFEKRLVVLEFKDDVLTISPEVSLVKEAENNTPAQIEKRLALQNLIEGVTERIDDIEMPVSDFTMAIAVNAHWMLEALKSIPMHHYIDIGLTDWSEMITIKEATGINDDEMAENYPYFHLIMPLRSHDVETFDYNNDDERMYFDTAAAG